MIYTIKKANLISSQLKKLSTADSWIVAGQFSNIDFWLEEVKSAYNAIEGHNQRFQKMCDARIDWIDSRNIKIPNNCPICQGICEFGHAERAPRIPKKSSKINALKKQSKIELIDSAYYFLLRFYKLKLYNEQEFQKKCKEINTSVDLGDLNIEQ